MTVVNKLSKFLEKMLTGSTISKSFDCSWSGFINQSCKYNHLEFKNCFFLNTRESIIFEGKLVTYISCLNNVLNIVTQSKFFFGFSFGEMKEYLFDDIGTFDETETFFHRTYDALIFDRMGRVLQTDMTCSKISSVTNKYPLKLLYYRKDSSLLNKLVSLLVFTCCSLLFGS